MSRVSGLEIIDYATSTTMRVNSATRGCGVAQQSRLAADEEAHGSVASTILFVSFNNNDDDDDEDDDDNVVNHIRGQI